MNCSRLWLPCHGHGRRAPVHSALARRRYDRAANKFIVTAIRRRGDASKRTWARNKSQEPGSTDPVLYSLPAAAAAAADRDITEGNAMFYVAQFHILPDESREFRFLIRYGRRSSVRSPPTCCPGPAQPSQPLPCRRWFMFNNPRPISSVRNCHRREMEHITCARLGDVTIPWPGRPRRVGTGSSETV